MGVAITDVYFSFLKLLGVSRVSKYCVFAEPGIGEGARGLSRKEIKIT